MTTLDRTQPPTFQLSSDYSLAQPEHFTLANGSDLYVFRQLEQEVVKMELIFDAGKWYESAPGISHFTAQMLSKGTEGKNSFQIAEALDSLGAHLEISPGFDVVTLSLFSLRKKLLPAVRILSEILEKPVFDDEELRQMKEIFVQSLKVNNKKSSVVASKKIRQTIFGNAHPYGNVVEEEDVAEVTAKGIREFYHTSFSLRSVYLIGKLTEDELQEVIGFLPSVRSNRGALRTFKIITGTSQKIIQPDSVQASIRLGKRCILKEDRKDYFDAVMFNHILGGFFGSRLMKNIREEKGLTYGIHASMNHFLHDSFWAISAEVNQTNAIQAIAEIRHEIGMLQNELVPADELEIAINYFIGSWQSENATMFAIAERIKNIHLWGLPTEYFTHLMEHVRNITPEQIQITSRTHFDAGDLVEILVA